MALAQKANVAMNPVFGMGLGEWTRPGWMGSSVDNFWLLITMRHGLPAFIPLALATILILRKISWARLDHPFEQACRAAVLTTLGGMLLASGTVHFWNAMYVWFIFLIGSGTYLIDLGDANEATAAAEAEEDTKTEGTKTEGANKKDTRQKDLRQNRGKAGSQRSIPSRMNPRDATPHRSSSAIVQRAKPDKDRQGFTSRFTRGSLKKGRKFDD